MQTNNQSEKKNATLINIGGDDYVKAKRARPPSRAFVLFSLKSGKCVRIGSGNSYENASVGL